MDTKQNPNIIEFEDKKYNINDVAINLSNANVEDVAEVFKVNEFSFLRKLRMDAMRVSLRPGIVKTRNECLTLDSQLNYRLLWFNKFSEGQMAYYFEFFKDSDLNRKFAEKLYRNILIALSKQPEEGQEEDPKKKQVLDDLIRISLDYEGVEPKKIKIENFNTVLDPYFVDRHNSLDGLKVEEFRPICYNSATKDQIMSIGEKYGVEVPRKINKHTIGEYVLERLRAMGVDVTEFEKEYQEMKVKDIRAFALDNGLQTFGELNKKEVIEYILQRAETTKPHYVAPTSDSVYEMNIPISDEEAIYDRLMIEKMKMQEEIERETKRLEKLKGEQLEEAKRALEEKSKEQEQTAQELEAMRQKLEAAEEQAQQEEFEQMFNQGDATNEEFQFEVPVEEQAQTTAETAETVEEPLADDTSSLDLEPLDVYSGDNSLMVSPTASGGGLMIYDDQQSLMILEKTQKRKTNLMGLIVLLVLLLLFFIGLGIGIAVWKKNNKYSEAKTYSDMKLKVRQGMGSLKPITALVEPNKEDDVLRGELVIYADEDIKNGRHLDDIKRPDFAKYIMFEGNKGESEELKFVLKYRVQQTDPNKPAEKYKEYAVLDLNKAYEHFYESETPYDYLLQVRARKMKLYINLSLKIDFRNYFSIHGPDSDGSFGNGVLVKTKGYDKLFEKYGTAKTLRNTLYKNLGEEIPEQGSEAEKDTRQWYKNRTRTVKIQSRSDFQEMIKKGGVTFYSDNRYTDGLTLEFRFMIRTRSGEQPVKYTNLSTGLDENVVESIVKEFREDPRNEAIAIDGWEAINNVKLDDPGRIPVEFGTSLDARFDNPEYFPSKRIIVEPKYRKGNFILQFLDETYEKLPGQEDIKVEVPEEINGDTWNYQLPKVYEVSDPDKYFANWVIRSNRMRIKDNSDILKEFVYGKTTNKVELYPEIRDKASITLRVLGLENYEINNSPLQFEVKGRHEEQLFNEGAISENIKNSLPEFIEQIKQIEALHAPSNLSIENAKLYINGELVKDDTRFEDVRGYVYISFSHIPFRLEVASQEYKVILGSQEKVSVTYPYIYMWGKDNVTLDQAQYEITAKDGSKTNKKLTKYALELHKIKNREIPKQDTAEAKKTNPDLNKTPTAGAILRLFVVLKSVKVKVYTENYGLKNGQVSGNPTVITLEETQNFYPRFDRKAYRNNIFDKFVLNDINETTVTKIGEPINFPDGATEVKVYAKYKPIMEGKIKLIQVYYNENNTPTNQPFHMIHVLDKLPLGYEYQLTPKGVVCQYYKSTENPDGIVPGGEKIIAISKDKLPSNTEAGFFEFNPESSSTKFELNVDNYKSDVQMIAHFRRKAITITVYPGEGQFASGEAAKTLISCFGAKINTRTIDIPTASGKTFKGWKTKGLKTDQQYTNEDINSKVIDGLANNDSLAFSITAVFAGAEATIRFYYNEVVNTGLPTPPPEAKIYNSLTSKPMKDSANNDIIQRVPINQDFTYISKELEGELAVGYELAEPAGTKYTIPASELNKDGVVKNLVIPVYLKNFDLKIQKLEQQPDGSIKAVPNTYYIHKVPYQGKIPSTKDFFDDLKKIDNLLPDYNRIEMEYFNVTDNKPINVNDFKMPTKEVVIKPEYEAKEVRILVYVISNDPSVIMDIKTPKGYAPLLPEYHVDGNINNDYLSDAEILTAVKAKNTTPLEFYVKANQEVNLIELIGEQEGYENVNRASVNVKKFNTNGQEAIVIRERSKVTMSYKFLDSDPENAGNDFEKQLWYGARLSDDWSEMHGYTLFYASTDDPTKPSQYRVLKPNYIYADTTVFFVKD